MKNCFHFQSGSLQRAGSIIKRYFIFALGIFFLSGLSACGNWKPEVSGTDTATGGAVVRENTGKDYAEKKEPVREPTMAEVEIGRTHV